MDSIRIMFIFILSMFLITSSFFSAAVIAFIFFKNVHIKKLKLDGNKKTGKELYLVDNYDRLLSTFLIGNQIVKFVSIIVAAFIFMKYIGEMEVMLTTAVIIAGILLLGEISVKNIARKAPERFFMYSTPALKVFIHILTPLNLIYMHVKKALKKRFHVSGDKNIVGINGKKTIDIYEQRVIDVLTPKINITAASIHEKNEEIRQLFIKSGYSRIPIYQDSLDDITGILEQKVFNKQVIEGGKKYEDVMKSPIFIPPSMKVYALLKIFKDNKSHMAVILDEYGGTWGIVTLDDLTKVLSKNVNDLKDELFI